MGIPYRSHASHDLQTSAPLAVVIARPPAGMLAGDFVLSVLAAVFCAEHASILGCVAFDLHFARCLAIIVRTDKLKVETTARDGKPLDTWATNPRASRLD
jgi:hypothetical protein